MKRPILSQTTRISAITIALLLVSLRIYSQPKPFKRIAYVEPKIYSVGFRGGFGVIVPHRESMIHLVTGHIASSEFYIEKCGRKKDWNHYYNFPTYGFSFYYAYLANPNTLGNAFALDYFTNLHLIKKTKWMFDIRLASGLGFLTKTFDPDINNHNVAIGSKINISIGASFDFKFHLGRDWQMSTGLSLKHFSNGSFSTPNLGINMPVWMVGFKKILTYYQYEYSQLDSSMMKHYHDKHERHFKFSATAGLGAKEIYPAGGNRYGTYALELNASWYPNFKCAFSGGADIIHNVALYKHAYNIDTLTGMRPKEFTQAGIHIGYAQVFNRFELFMQCAIYAVNKYNKDGNYYQRLGGRFYFNHHINVHFALKTHFAKADYFELGLGYYFRKNNKTNKNATE